MSKMNRLSRLETVCKWFLIAAIFLYPFICSFIGIDLGDTGYHLYAFENFFDNPDKISFTSFFTNVTGWAWLQLFGNLGLWGLNLLEVGIEMIMAFVVYKTFHKYLGVCETLLGILIAVAASDTYLNVFNYHQYNVLFLVLILSMQFLAITKDKPGYSALAGVFFATVCFARMGSITAAITIFLYVFWYLFQNKKIVFLLKHFLCFLIGTLLMGAAMVGLLMGTGLLENFVNNIFRLSGLASSDGDYGMSNLWDSFIGGNLDALASGFIFATAFIILVIGLNLILNRQKNVKRYILNFLVGLVAMIAGVYQMIYAYDVNEAPSWPQMTTGPSFIIGVCYIVTFLCIIYHMYGEGGKKEIALICLAAVILPLLAIAGSNTGTKHVVLGLWIIAPVCSYTIIGLCKSKVFYEKLRECTLKIGISAKRGAVLLALFIAIGCVGVKFIHMMYYTMNFDSVDRSMINSQISNDKVKFLWTTQREADAVNGTLDKIAQGEKTSGEHPLIVFGNSLLYYYMLDKEAFADPWFSNPNYSNEDARQDLEDSLKESDKLPIVIYGRTNNNYGFYEYNYDVLIESQRSNTYEGKKDVLIEFLDNNEYSMEYINDYYMVMFPPDMTEEEKTDYYYEMTGWDR